MEVWYPSHVEKAKRAIKSLVKIVGGIVEVVDARAPMGTRPTDVEPYFANKMKVIFLNKSDLADPKVTSRWVKFLSKDGTKVLHGSLKEMKNAKEIFEPFSSKPDVNIMIIGMPNVGKSTLVNMVRKKRSAVIGDRPGVTRAVQWIRISDHLKILDTPGITYPKIFNDLLYSKLGLCNVIDVEKVDFEALIYYEMDLLNRVRPDVVSSVGEGDTVMEKIESYGRNRGFISKGGVVDMNRALLTLHREVTHAKFGRISYETPEEWEKSSIGEADSHG